MNRGVASKVSRCANGGSWCIFCLFLASYIETSNVSSSDASTFDDT